VLLFIQTHQMKTDISCLIFVCRRNVRDGPKLKLKIRVWFGMTKMISIVTCTTPVLMSWTPVGLFYVLQLDTNSKSSSHLFMHRNYSKLEISVSETSNTSVSVRLLYELSF